MKKEENTTNSRNEKQLLINKIYAHLVGKQILSNKKEMANLIGYNDKNFISATNGSERYLTSGLFNKIYAKFPETRDISLDSDLNRSTSESLQSNIEQKLEGLMSEVESLKMQLKEQNKENKRHAEEIVKTIAKERQAIMEVLIKTLATQKKENI